MSKVLSGIRVSRSILASVIVLAVLTAAPGHASHGAGSITALAIDPLSPSTVYAGTVDGGVFKSIDGGTTWNSTGLTGLCGAVSVLTIDPVTTTTLYAVNGCGLFKSTDGGATWTASLTSVDNSPDGYAEIVIGVVVDPLAPGKLYAAIYLWEPAVAWEHLGTWSSTDGGESWGAESWEPLDWWQGLGIRAIDPRPTPPTLYGAGVYGNVHRSADAGASWSDTGLYEIESSAPSSIYVADVALDPVNVATLYYAASGAVFKSTDGGVTWNPVNAGLTEAVTALAIDPVTPTTLYAGTAARVFRTRDGGATWSSASTGLGLDADVRTLALDPQSPATLYAGTGSGVFKSTDGGANWSPTGPIPPPDTVAPDTSIGSMADDKGGSIPNGGITLSNVATVVFTGTDDVAVAGFECRVDGASFTSCTTPTTYNGLAVGRHDFEVRAVDSSGNLDGTPAFYSWTIDSPPETTITSAIDRQGNPIPNGGTTRSNVIVFSFTGTDNVSVTGFECSFDGAAFAACESPITYTAVSRGSHTFRVRAVDTNAFRDATPAYFVWTR